MSLLKRPFWETLRRYPETSPFQTIIASGMHFDGPVQKPCAVIGQRLHWASTDSGFTQSKRPDLTNQSERAGFFEERTWHFLNSGVLHDAPTTALAKRKHLNADTFFYTHTTCNTCLLSDSAPFPLQPFYKLTTKLLTSHTRGTFLKTSMGFLTIWLHSTSMYWCFFRILNFNSSYWGSSKLSKHQYLLITSTCF